jgi:dihydroorotase
MLVLEGRAFYRGRLEPLAVGVDHGRIERIAKVLEGDERRAYGDRLLLPGGVDLHVHFRDPGMTEKEDFATGTMAAAIGGVTTVLDMPNTRPPVTGLEAYQEKMALVRRKANVDFGLAAAIRSAEDVTRFSGIAPAGKVYMAPTTGDLAVSDDAVRAIVAEAAQTKLLLSVHAEAMSALAKEEGRTLPGHDHMRPPEAEAAAIGLLDRAAMESHGSPRIHVAHLSSAKGLEALARTPFTAEVTPHHLFLECTMTLHARGKVNPPLRSAADRKALWPALVEGRIPCVASDHAPHTAEEKDLPFERAPAGVPGVETMLPLLLREVKRGDLPLERFVDATAKRPADLLGLNVGEIEVGRVANLIVVDPRETGPIKARGLHSKCGWTPFEGMEAIFPQATYVRGELAAEGRELVGDRLGKPIPVPKPS